MALTDVLEGLGGLSRGIMQGTDFNQRQQYNQLLTAMAQQQLLEQQRQKAMQAGLGSTLRQYFAQQGDAGQPSPTTGQGAQPIQPFQPPPPMQLPQIPNTAGALDPRQTVRGSWFGNYGNWHDPSDSGLQAGGQPVSAGPGIALPTRSTLGKMFDVTTPRGDTYQLPQTDIGPAKWTGRGVDINAPAAEAMGYTPQNFPTDAPFRVQLASANQTYAQLKGSMPPPLAQAASAGAGTTLRSISDQPLQLQGRLQPADLWKAVDTANPNAGDDIKAAIFTNLYPMLSSQGKIDFGEAMQVLNYRQRGDEFTQRQAQQREEFTQRQQGIDAQREFNRQISTERLGQAGAKGWTFLQQQDGSIVRANPNTGEVEPVQAAGQATKLGTRPAGGAATDSEAEFALRYWKATGTFPFGMGRNQALQNKVLEKAAAEGIDPAQIATAVGSFKADQSALTQATKLRDAVHGYEGTVLRNLELSRQKMEQAAPTGFGPWINHWAMTGEMQMGDEKPPGAIAAVLTTANEFAKVMSGSTGAQAATDSSRHEAATILSPYFNKGQFKEAADVVKQEMHNRMTELDDNVDLIKSRMGRGGASAPSGDSKAGGPDYSKMSDDELLKAIGAR